MAGYSGTPLAKKLGIQPGARLLRVNAPKGLDELLAPLPEGVRPVRGRTGGVNVILFFTDKAVELARRFPELAGQLDPAGGLWVGWPKKASGVPTDITEDTLREVALPLGLVDNKVCAVDETWSGLRVVWRKELRDGLRKQP
jgi:hypothetical protein